MTNPRSDVDWQAQAEIFAGVRAVLVHGDEPMLYGQDFEAKALERFAEQAGWMTKAEVEWHVDGHRIVASSRVTKLEAEVAQLKAEVRRLYAEAARDLVGWLRKDAEEPAVGKLPAGKRAGIRLACAWLDNAIRKNERTAS